MCNIGGYFVFVFFYAFSVWLAVYRLIFQDTVMTKIQTEFHGLSNRTINTLVTNGYHTKKEALKGFLNGEINPSKKGLLNFGAKTYIEVCAWLGVKPEEQEPNKKTISNYIKYLQRHGYKVSK